ncbi:hypothetical protein [Pantoea ananatis]|uniref:hypothetical protein n=1 Tax=Pantoea ananas TaxID=553 RepID=UPI001F4C9E8D|nr:hypothetical protein [Pantoea ananatis]MDS7722345.1 hypothetical protein [Pantoea ananatis]
MKNTEKFFLALAQILICSTFTGPTRDNDTNHSNNLTVTNMELSKFEVRTGLWPHMHFTDIEYDQRGSSYEIYATDVTNQTKSKLFICRTVDEQQAKLLSEQFRIWLPKINSKKRKAAAKNPPTGYDRIACHKG